LHDYIVITKIRWSNRTDDGSIISLNSVSVHGTVSTLHVISASLHSILTWQMTQSMMPVMVYSGQKLMITVRLWSSIRLKASEQIIVLKWLRKNLLTLVSGNMKDLVKSALHILQWYR